MADARPHRHRARRAGSTMRFKVTAVATAVVAATLVATAVGAVVVQRRALTDTVDDRVRQRAADLEALVMQRSLPGGLPASGDDDAFAQVVDGDGEVVVETANLVGDGPVTDALPEGTAARLRTVDGIRLVDDDGELATDESFRLLSRRVLADDGTFVVHVGAPLDDVEESVAVLGRTLAVAFPVVLGLVAGLVWVLAGRVLRPVEAIRAEVAGMSGADLGRRVPEPPTDDEIGRLARTMNALLARIEEAQRRQERFVSDASHELRSPLTSIRSELEVDLAHPDAADLAATHRSVLDEVIALQRLVDDLLYLARADAGEAPLRRLPVDLDDIVLREVAAIRARGDVAVDASGVSAAQVDGDSDALRRAIRNVLDNAERYAASAVTVSLAERDGYATLAVADDGPGIPADQREHVFERFARLDAARARGTGGTGLGLSITREIVGRHGGAVGIADRPGGGTVVTITLPLASPRQ